MKIIFIKNKIKLAFIYLNHIMANTDVCTEIKYLNFFNPRNFQKMLRTNFLSINIYTYLYYSSYQSFLTDICSG